MRFQLRNSLVVSITLLACSTPVATSASVSPSKLLTSILAAGRAERSVHYVSSARSETVQLRQVSDVGVAQGVQRITFRKGAKTGHATVIVSAKTAYVRADTFALINYMGFKATPAAKYAGVWILIPHADSDYSTVAEAVTLSTTINELRPLKPLSMLPQTQIGGQRVIGVRGRDPFSSALSPTVKLYARAAGSPLPVEEVTTHGTFHSAVTFSKWNESVDVTAPSGAVPISTTGLE